jgi:hypothetical protein
MMKVVECMEDDSMHRKMGTMQILQLTKVSAESIVQTMCGFKGSQKRKWEKKPPKDNLGCPQKTNHVAKVKFFNYNELGHYAKDHKKVRDDFVQGKFIAKANVAKLRPNLTLLKFKVGINKLMCLLD